MEARDKLWELIPGCPLGGSHLYLLSHLTNCSLSLRTYLRHMSAMGIFFSCFFLYTSTRDRTQGLVHAR